MSRKRQPSMWRDGHRRSPRISALGDWRAHQPSLLVQHSGDPLGPPSRTRTRTRTMTRARVKRKLKDVDVDVDIDNSPSTKPQHGTQSPPTHEDHSTNIYQLLDLNATEGPKHGDHATCTGQTSVMQSVPSTSEMPEKRILELILDVLQRRDTYEIFAEPVDPNEVEDYYEIIEEPMDFGTMRAKLHEGMYRSLEEFEHDAFLIPQNAMHFNSSATIYFRQARAIQELAKKVFHVLKTDPDNFELEFSGARRRSIRRTRSEARGFNSFLGLSPNARSGSKFANVSSKGAPCTSSTLKGPSSYRTSIQGNFGFPSTVTPVKTRANDSFQGARNSRRSSFVEADRRCTYRPWTSIHNDNNSAVSTTYNDPKSLTLVTQRDISYRESLMSFVKDLGPTAQMIAKRKLKGCLEDAPSSQTPTSNSWIQALKCPIPTSFASTQREPSTLGTTVTDTSTKFLNQLSESWPILSKTTEIIDLTDADDGENAYMSDSMGNHGAQGREVASNNEQLSNHDWKKVFFRVSETKKVNHNQSAGDLKSSILGINNTGSRKTCKLDNKVQPLVLASEYSHESKVFEFKLKNDTISLASSSWPTPVASWVSSSSQTNAKMQSLGSRCKAIASSETGDGVSSLTQAGESLQSNRIVPTESEFNFKSRLNQMNFFGEERFLQPRYQREGTKCSLDQMSCKTSFNCAQPVEPSTRSVNVLNNQLQSSLDTMDIDTDLTLQLAVANLHTTPNFSSTKRG